MEQQTNTVRERALFWFESMTNETAQHYYLKYEKCIDKDRLITADIKEKIYRIEILSENPQTEPMVEDVQVGGFNLLLNEGEDDEQTVSLVDYINMFDEDMEDDFIKVINLLSGQSYQYGADNIKRI